MKKEKLRPDKTAGPIGFFIKRAGNIFVFPIF